MYNSMLTSNNSFNFQTPITQTQNAMGGGNQQSLNLSYNIPVTVGVPLPPSGYVMPQQPPPQQPQQPQYGQPPQYPPQPQYPQPPQYPPQPPWCPPPQQPPWCPPQYCYPPQQPPIIIQPPPQQPQQPDFSLFQNFFNSVIQVINQNKQQPSPAPQQDSSNISLLLVLLLFNKQKPRRSSPPPTQPPPQPPPPPPPVRVDDYKEEAKVISKKGSPLVLDLDGQNGVNTSDSQINFDLDGDGKSDLINNIAKGDAVLTIDSDRNGVSGEGGDELLGDFTDLRKFGIQGKFSDGYDALGAIVKDAIARGLIDPKRANTQYLDDNDLKILEQYYGLRIKVGGLENDSQSLSSAGVKGISLANGKLSRVNDFDGRGNDLLNKEGATFTRTDGSEGGYGDIFFKF
jgi:hypothetical protein